jgi:hypothetical protein
MEHSYSRNLVFVYLIKKHHAFPEFTHIYVLSNCQLLEQYCVVLNTSLHRGISNKRRGTKVSFLTMYSAV